MKSPSPASKVTSRANCKICRDVPSFHIVDDVRGERFPPAVYRLEECEEILRCPLCSTFYLMETESAPDHYLAVTTTLTRISDEVALGELATMLATCDHRFIKAATAKRWMVEFDVDGRVAKLVTKLKTARAAKAAATLAEIYFALKDWDDLEALLRHDSSAARGGALGAIESRLEDTAPGVIDAVLALLADNTHAHVAHGAFNHLGNRLGSIKVSPLIITLVECLDDGNARVRALVVDSILHHLEPVSGYYNPRHPKLNAKDAKTLFEWLPILVGHIVKPRPAHWLDIEASALSEKARERPRKLTTGVGASQILSTMINRGKKGKASVRQAFEAARPELRRMLSRYKVGDLDADVHDLAREVTGDGEILELLR